MKKKVRIQFCIVPRQQNECRTFHSEMRTPEHTISDPHVELRSKARTHRKGNEGHNEYATKTRYLRDLRLCADGASPLSREAPRMRSVEDPDAVRKECSQPRMRSVEDPVTTPGLEACSTKTHGKCVKSTTKKPWKPHNAADHSEID